MKTVAIIGGKLQGVEAVYLAKKAGMKSLLIDKNPMAPASGFCDEMGVFDVFKKEPQLIELLKKADFILPALEVDEVHDALLEISEQYGFKFAFDKGAYAITSSKRKSDELMRKHLIPTPKHFTSVRELQDASETCDAYIIKPSEESGSVGVFRVETVEEVRHFLDGANNHEEADNIENVYNSESWVVQEYLEGRSYSIEVIGIPGSYRTYEITEIHMDDEYDCKMVTAPCFISDSAQEGLSDSAKEELFDSAKDVFFDSVIDEFSKLAIRLAELVKLKGIMDVEVIDHNGTLKVLEIDARIPSQTPMAVYHSSGVNLLSELADITLNGKFTDKNLENDELTNAKHEKEKDTSRSWKADEASKKILMTVEAKSEKLTVSETDSSLLEKSGNISDRVKTRKYTAIEHYLIDETGAHHKGESIMGESRPLVYRENFFGADEALTDYDENKSVWRATFINSADSEEGLAQKRIEMLRQLNLSIIKT